MELELIPKQHYDCREARHSEPAEEDRELYLLIDISAVCWWRAECGKLLLRGGATEGGDSIRMALGAGRAG